MNQRDAILSAVRQWLDAHPGEPLPPGLDPAAEATPAPDLLTLSQALVAVRHDVQLQTKVLKRLEEKLDAPRATAASAEAERQASRADVIDLFDRVRRCVVAARAAPTAEPGLRAHLDGLARGLELTLARAEEALARLGLRVYDPSGAAFDGRRMVALASAPASAACPPGHVAEVVKVGFVALDSAEQAVRMAEVLVAR